MESILQEIADFQFDFDAMNLDPNAFPDLTQPHCNFEFPIDSMFELETSFNSAANALPYHDGDGTLSTGFTTPESVSSPEADQLFIPDIQPSEPTWTPIMPQVPTQQALPPLPLVWRPCSPPLLPVEVPQHAHSRWRPCSPPHTPKLMHASTPVPLKQFQYPDPQIHSVSQSVPYPSLPPRSVPDQGSVSPLRSTKRPIESPTNMTSAPIAGSKRRRSIHLEDLYTSDQESAPYDSDSSLSSAPPSPSVSSPPCLTPHGVKMGPKHKLEQTVQRQALNERRGAYYHRAKQDPAWKARHNASERSKYYKRQAATFNLHAEVAPARISKKAVSHSAKTTPEKSTITSKKHKPKWKGWVVLPDEEESSEQVVGISVSNAKKRKMTKEIENTKDFVQSRGQAEGSDGDDSADEDDDDEYRIISVDRSHRRAAYRDTSSRRSRRAKQPASYAEE